MAKRKNLALTDLEIFSNCVVYGISTSVSFPRFNYIVDRAFNLVFVRLKFDLVLELGPSKFEDFSRAVYIVDADTNEGIILINNTNANNTFLIPELPLFDFFIVFDSIEIERLFGKELLILKEDNLIQNMSCIKLNLIKHKERLFADKIEN